MALACSGPTDSSAVSWTIRVPVEDRQRAVEYLSALDAYEDALLSRGFTRAAVANAFAPGWLSGDFSRSRVSLP
jgi:hypothetical protein